MQMYSRNAALLQVVADRLRQACSDDPATVEELAATLEKVAAELLFADAFPPAGQPLASREGAGLLN